MKCQMKLLVERQIATNLPRPSSTEIFHWKNIKWNTCAAGFLHRFDFLDFLFQNSLLTNSRFIVRIFASSFFRRRVFPWKIMSKFRWKHLKSRVKSNHSHWIDGKSKLPQKRIANLYARWQNEAKFCGFWSTRYHHGPNLKTANLFCKSFVFLKFFAQDLRQKRPKSWSTTQRCHFKIKMVKEGLNHKIHSIHPQYLKGLKRQIQQIDLNFWCKKL